MSHRTARRRAIGLVCNLTMAGALTAFGTSSQAATPGASHPLPLQGFWHALAVEVQPGDAWERLREHLQWQDQVYNERVQRWIEHYRANPHNVVEITERARPWLAWITEQIEQRGLPGEVALIPFIESSFNPQARSHRGAAGLWQFMPGTADALGLRRNGAYDGRLDVVSSTEAALDYIEQQADEWYEGDIELSLAAYNAGAGTVNRARRAALSRGLPGDYWSLRLPRETMNYLPKLLAIANIIAEPERHGVALPTIEDTPAFAAIPLTRPLSLGEVARLAGVSRRELARLNPGLINGSAHPNHTEVLLVPTDQEDALIASLEKSSPPQGRSNQEEYVVRRGDSLSAIASRHGISVAELRQRNGISGDVIRVGQVLAITTADQRLAAR